MRSGNSSEGGSRGAIIQYYGFLTLVVASGFGLLAVLACWLRRNCRQMRRRRMRSSTSSQDTPASGEGALERNKYLSLEEARVRRHRPPTVRAETLHLGGSNSIIRDTTRQKYS